jgi:hypothetical protein
MNTLKYKLFLDDERYPPDDDPCARWLVARSVSEAQDTIARMGYPVFISFDHDLGDNVPSGFDLSKWIVDQDLDNPVLPIEFDFYVHSQNPVGAANIEGLLRAYLKMKTG